MSLSKRSLDTLLDLVEIKISCMEVWDREDAREIANLQQARQELYALAHPCEAAAGGDPSGDREHLEVATRRPHGRPRSEALAAH